MGYADDGVVAFQRGPMPERYGEIPRRNNHLFPIDPIQIQSPAKIEILPGKCDRCTHGIPPKVLASISQNEGRYAKCRKLKRFVKPNRFHGSRWSDTSFYTSLRIGAALSNPSALLSFGTNVHNGFSKLLTTGTNTHIPIVSIKSNKDIKRE